MKFLPYFIAFILCSCIVLASPQLLSKEDMSTLDSFSIDVPKSDPGFFDKVTEFFTGEEATEPQELTRSDTEFTMIEKLDDNKHCITLTESLKQVCFTTNEPSTFYYSELESGDVKFGWQALNPTTDKFIITADQDLNQLKFIDWSDLNASNLTYTIEGNTLTISNPSLTSWWIDPVINTSLLYLVTNSNNQRKVIQMPNGNIYVTYFNREISGTYNLVVLSKSSDYGTTWTTWNLTTGSATSQNWYPSMILGIDNVTINLAWEVFVDAIDSNNDIAYAQWNTTSDTLLGITNIYNATSGTTEAYFPDIATLSNGTIGIIYERESTAEYINFKKCSSTCLTYSNWGTETIIANSNNSFDSQSMKRPDLETNGSNWYATWYGANVSLTSNNIWYSLSNNGTNWITPELVGIYNTGDQVRSQNSLIIFNNSPSIIALSYNNTITRYMIEYYRRNTTAWEPYVSIYNSTTLFGTYPQPQLTTDGTNLYAVWSGSNGSNNYSEETFTTGTTYELNNTAQQYHGWAATTTASVTQKIVNNEIIINDTSAALAGKILKMPQVTKPFRIDFSIKANDTSKTGAIVISIIGDTLTSNFTMIQINGNQLQVRTKPTSVTNLTKVPLNNTYHNISLRNINYTLGKYDIYIDEVLDASNVSSIINTSYLSRITIETYTTSQNLAYFDNIKYYNSTIDTASYEAVMYSNSTDNGTTWSAPIEIGENWALAYDNTRYPNLPYQWGRTQDISVLYTKDWDGKANTLSHEVIWQNITDASSTPTATNTSSVTATAGLVTPVNENSTTTHNVTLSWNMSEVNITNAAGTLYWNGTTFASTEIFTNDSMKIFETNVSVGWTGGQTIITNWTVQYTLNDSTTNTTNTSNKNQVITALNSTLGITTNQTSYISETDYADFGVHFSFPSGLTNITTVYFMWNLTQWNATYINDTDYRAIVDVGLGNYSTTYSWNYTALYLNGSSQWHNTSNITSIRYTNLSTTISGLTGTLTQNMLLKEDEGDTIINGTIEGVLYYTLLGGNQSYIKNRSYKVNATNASFYKMNDSHTYLVNSTVYYTAPDYTEKTYVYNNASWTNTSSNATLYLTNSTGVNAVIFTVTDLTGIRQPGSLIVISKLIPATGVYNNVETLITNFDAEAVSTSIVLYNETYRFTIIKNGITYLITTPTPVFRTEMTFKIDLQNLFINSYPLLHLNSILTYNNNTGAVQWDYTDTSGIFHEACLKVYNDVSGTRTEICPNNCALASTSTLGCDASSVTQGTLTMQGWINTNTSRSDYLMDQLIVPITNAYKTIFGPNGTSSGMGIFACILLTGTLAMIGVSITAGTGIIFTILGLIISTLIGIIWIPIPMLAIITIGGGALAWSMKT